MRVPEVRYARSGDLRLAYQKWGDGPPLLIIPDLISNCEVTWEHESYRRTYEHLGKHMTCVYFDKRGIGMSDRFDEAPTLEQRDADVLAVMDEVGWSSAHIVGQSEGGAMGMLFAVEHPERVESLTIMNSFVPPTYRPRLDEFVRDGDPPMLSEEDIYGHFIHILGTWGEDASYLVGWECPSQVGNEAFTRWMARLMRFAASPNDFVRQLDSIFNFDAGDAPERVTTRTQVIHVTGDLTLTVAGGRLLADLIPDAKLVEVDGADHFSWIMPNWRDIADEVITFAIGGEIKRTTSRKFATVMFTDIVDSTKQSAAVGDEAWRGVLDGHDRTARRLIDQHDGQVIKSTGDGLLATFDSPSQGVECGLQLAEELRGIGIDIRAGIHAGEIEVHDDGNISGIAVNLAARVEQCAGNGELWSSPTVRDMLLGSAATFDDQGEHALKGIDGAWRLYAVSGA